MLDGGKRWVALALVAAAAGGFAGCGRDGSGAQLRVAYVTNGVDPFWTIAAAGAKAGGKEFGVDVDVQMPANGIVDQKRIIEDLLSRGVAGIALSPIDGENQVELIDQACAATKVITHDSDAPKSRRLCFVGMDNYLAGRECGKLVKEALPQGGSVMLFIGRLEQDNARKRRQGVIDELLDRSVDSSRHDPVEGEQRGAKYVVLDTRTDQFDRARAKANAEDALARHPDLGAMVGLFAYNPPACLEALKGAGKLGQVKVCSFDEDDTTLQGILDGHVQGTVCQQPYRYGFESVRILVGLARGDASVLPPGGLLDVPVQVIRKAQVRAFWDEKKKLLASGA